MTISGAISALLYMSMSISTLTVDSILYMLGDSAVLYYAVLDLFIHSFIHSCWTVCLACLLASRRTHVGLLRARAGAVSASTSIQHHRHQQTRTVLSTQGLGCWQWADTEPHRGTGRLHWWGGGGRGHRT